MRSVKVVGVAVEVTAVRTGEHHHGPDPAQSGQILVAGEDLTGADILTRRRKFAFVPQDRGRMGASVSASITENAMMTHHRLNGRFTEWKGLLLNFRKARQYTDELVERFSVSLGSQAQPFKSLSGGNQQKLIRAELCWTALRLARPAHPRWMWFHRVVHSRSLRCAKTPCSLLFSADLEELLRLADRLWSCSRAMS